MRPRLITALVFLATLTACTRQESERERWLREQDEQERFRLVMCRERSHSDSELCAIAHVLERAEKRCAPACAGVYGAVAMRGIAGLQARYDQRAAAILLEHEVRRLELERQAAAAAETAGRAR